MPKTTLCSLLLLLWSLASCLAPEAEGSGGPAGVARAATPDSSRPSPSDLGSIVRASDNAIWGRVVSLRPAPLADSKRAGASAGTTRTAEAASPRYEILLLEGESLFNGKPIQVEITLPVGRASLARPAVGDELVVFYRWQDALATELSGNAVVEGRSGLYASYRDATRRAFVRGGGPSAAIVDDERMSSLGRRVALLHRD